MEPSVPVPAFFRVLVGDFSEKMKLPTAFVNHYNGSATCTLQGPTGKSWDVELIVENDDIFFHKGWKKFLKDNFLDEGDFLVFNYDGDSCFEVTIYDETACEMDMEVAKRSGRGLRRDHVPPRESRMIEFNSEHFCFKRTFKKFRMYQLTIPKKIATGKLQMSKQTIKLRDPKNRSWPATVTPMADGRLLLNTGWRACCKANQIGEGHTIVFELVKGHMKLHFFRSEGSNVVLTGPNVVD